MKRLLTIFACASVVLYSAMPSVKGSVLLGGHASEIVAAALIDGLNINENPYGVKIRIDSFKLYEMTASLVATNYVATNSARFQIVLKSAKTPNENGWTETPLNVVEMTNIVTVIDNNRLNIAMKERAEKGEHFFKLKAIAK